jgi:hypothetical protein
MQPFTSDALRIYMDVSVINGVVKGFPVNNVSPTIEYHVTCPDDAANRIALLPVHTDVSFATGAGDSGNKETVICAVVSAHPY